MTNNIKADKYVDLTGEVCPYTFVKSKLAIEKMDPSEILAVEIDYKPALENVPKSMKNEGHRIQEISENGKDEWTIYIKKVK
ncbi:MAG: sulfurtransferase TusA family protein [Candidatus Hadarchaeota archaeon]